MFNFHEFQPKNVNQRSALFTEVTLLKIEMVFNFKKFQNYRLPLLVVSGHYVTKFLLAVGIRWFIEVVTRTRRVRVPLREQLRWLLPVGACASLDIGLSNWALEYVSFCTIPESI